MAGAPPITTFPSSSTIAELVGVQDVVKVPNPAAGADWIYTVPSGYFRRLISGTAILTTSSNAANRLLGFEITDGTNNLAQGWNGTALTASLTIQVGYFVGTGGGVSIAGSVSSVGGIPNVWLPPGYTLESDTVALNVTDQYSAIFLWFECLDFGAYGQRQLMHERTANEIAQTVEVGGATVTEGSQT
jgi:hypothetical protein